MLVQDDRPARAGAVELQTTVAGWARTSTSTISLDVAPWRPAGSADPTHRLSTRSPTDQATTHHRHHQVDRDEQRRRPSQPPPRNPRRHRDCAPGNAPSERSERVGAPVEDSPAATTQWSDGPRRRSRLERKNVALPERDGAAPDRPSHSDDGICSVPCLTQGVPDTRRSRTRRAEIIPAVRGHHAASLTLSARLGVEPSSSAGPLAGCHRWRPVDWRTSLSGSQPWHGPWPICRRRVAGPPANVR